jgi:hypothetical protein
MTMILRTAKQSLPFLIGTLIFSTLSCSMSKDRGTAQKAVETFHGQFNQERYHDIFAEAGEEFKKVTSEEELATFLSAVHRKLGKVKSSDPMGWHVNYTPSGTVVTLGYNSEFDEGKATEQFIWRVSGDKATLLRYDINSPTLITK